MNIGEHFYCSRCMKEIDAEGVCPHCGYDPVREQSTRYVAEGTLLHEGRYQLGTVVGQGGFGATYGAWDLVLDMPVAVKEYFPGSYASRDVMESDDVIPNQEDFLPYQMGLRTFIREARILASLQNIETVVTVYDCFEENHTAYIIMEYVRGMTLFQYCREKKIKEKALLKMLRSTMDDLILIHNSGVLHRDIGPENLLVQEDGAVKLIDFGAATKLKKDGKENFSLNRSFAAPEQFDPEGREGSWTDVYGLAATLYTVISGDIIAGACSRMENDMLKPLRHTKIPVSRRVKKAIDRGLRLETEKRTQTIEELRAEVYRLPRPLKTRKQKLFAVLKGVGIMAALEAAALLAWYGGEIHILRQAELAVSAYTTQNSEAAYILATGYREGRFEGEEFPGSQKLSVYWYEWAAEHGNPEAMFDYASILQEGEFAAQDIPRAIDLYTKAADEGVSMAMNQMGVLYLEGEYVEKDVERADSYFQEAAKLGNTMAMVNLGEIYRQGLGGKTDEELAASYYKKAADLGDTTGIYLLGCSYGDGMGVEKNDFFYYKFCYDAALGGNQEAMCRIGRFYITGELGFKDESKGAEWYQKAADTGSVEALYILATLYRDGIGVEQDAEAASSYMFFAAMDGWEQAEIELKEMSDSGYGVFSKENASDTQPDVP